MYSSTPTRQEQQVMAKSVGERLKEAREMVGLAQLEAATQIGYANSSKLSKIEKGKHSSQIPMWMLKRAAQVYDVSLDYLLGITETMERNGPDHSIMREMMIHMREEWNISRGRDLLITERLNGRIRQLEDCFAHMESAASDAELALARVVELNPEWQDMRGGSRLADATQATSAAIRNAQHGLKLLQRKGSVVSVSRSQPQIDLVFV